LVSVASVETCAVSAVQATRETLLPYYGTVGGRRVPGRKDLYAVERVTEKPTPTEAELNLIVPGLRAGHYLCFFGMHVLTPTVMEILSEQVLRARRDGNGVTLSGALAILAGREKYLALEENAQRYDVGVRYGLLTAQLALALSGKDRDEVLTRLVELLAMREMGLGSSPSAVERS
jgi:UTP--glucose-1-phosphate uridylyltransferase